MKQSIETVKTEKEPTMEKHIKLTTEDITTVNVAVKDAQVGETAVLQVAKPLKNDTPDINTYAKLKDLQFHNGIIEVKMLSRLLPEAPDYARGFIGIVFRANDSDSEFESFYVRPTNGRGCTDPIRRSHGCQYFSFPGYTFSYFRDFGITAYEAPVDVALDEWITLKAVIEDDRAEFYLNHSPDPLLVVDGLKHGKGNHGAVGLYVDNGTEGYFSEIRVICTD